MRPIQGSILIHDMRHERGNRTILNGHDSFVSTSSVSRLTAAFWLPAASMELPFFGMCQKRGAIEQRRPRALTPSQREACWSGLDQNAKTAFKAMEKLFGDPGRLRSISCSKSSRRKVPDSIWLRFVP